jgi:ABC-type nitrate/sulfonate/bicarbonate transport system substrate-binding protein
MRLHHRTLIGMFVLLLFVVLLAACGGQATPAGPVKVTLRLPWIINSQFAGPYAAVDQGFFGDEGLEVEIRPGGFDINSITMVASGEDTFGLHDMGSLLLARSEGIPLIASATFFQKHPGAAMALADSGITTLQDFEGKTMGFQEGGPWMLTKAMLVANGVDPASMKQVTIGYDLTPLFNGDVDLTTVYATNEPLLAKAQGFDTVVFLPYDYGIETSSEALFTTDDYSKANPQIVCGMVRAIRRGWEWAVDNPDKAVDIVMAAGGEGLNRGAEMGQFNAQLNHLMTPDTDTNGLGYMTEARWQTAEDVLREQGALDTDVDVTKVFTTDCLGK